MTRLLPTLIIAAFLGAACIAASGSEAPAGITNHQAAPRISQDRDRIRRSSAPTVRIAIAG